MYRNVFTAGLLLIALGILDEFKAVNALDISSAIGQKLNVQCQDFCQHGDATGKVLLDEFPRKCECTYHDGSIEKFNLQNTQALEKAAELHASRRPKQTAPTNNDNGNTKHTDSDTKNSNKNKQDDSMSNGSGRDDLNSHENSFDNNKDKEKEMIRDQKSCQSHCIYNRFFGDAIFDVKKKTCSCHDGDETELYDTNGEVITNRQSTNSHDDSIPDKNHFPKENNEKRKTISTESCCQSHCIYNRFFGDAIFDVKKKTCSCHDGDETKLYDTNGEVITNPRLRKQKNQESNGNLGNDDRTNTGQDTQPQRTGKRQNQRKTKPFIDSRDKCISFCKNKKYRRATFILKKQICCCMINKSNYANYDLYGKLINEEH